MVVDASNVTAPSLGFYTSMTKETISIDKSIYDGMNKSFEKVEDVNKLDIDVIPDAGLVKLENAGHYSFLEQQFTFNRVMCSFMKIED